MLYVHKYYFSLLVPYKFKLINLSILNFKKLDFSIEKVLI